MRDFVKKIKLHFDANGVKELDEKIKKTFSNVKLGDGLNENAKNKINELQNLQKQLQNVNAAISSLGDVSGENVNKLSGFLNVKKHLQNEINGLNELGKKKSLFKGLNGVKINLVQNVGDLFKGIKNVFKGIADFFVNIFKSAFASIKRMTSFNSKGTGYSAEAYNQQMSLGLSDAENFAVSKIKEKMGVSDEEYFLGGYNDERAKKMDEFIELYKKQYEEMQESGFLNNMQNLSDRFEKFKEDMQNVVIKFIAKNGDTIMSLLQGIMDVLQAVFDVFNAWASLFSDETESDSTIASNIDNIINQNTFKNNNSRVNNFNINNTMSAKNTGITNKQQLTQATNQNLKQISSVLNKY